MITLVLGGVRSGKSEVAERSIALHGSPVTYIATALVDPEDASHVDRIERHRRRRPRVWTTVECPEPGRLADLLATTRGPVLVDSLGSWVVGHFGHRGRGGDEGAGFISRVDVATGELTAAIVTRTSPTVLVSEEVGMSVHPPSEAGRLFADAMGMVNQAVARVCDEVLLVVAGRVLSLPGRPEER